MKRTFFLAFLFLGFFSPLAHAVLPVFQSGPEQVPLLELYTSEGCSSCPAADEWIAQFQNHPDLWKKFIPVAFHVTYWDRLGWKDRFGSREFDQRQKAYVESWKAWNVATPTFVLNGKNWENWYETNRIPDSNPQQAGILSAKALDPEEYLITFKPLFAVSKPLEIHGALLGFSVSSSIQAGENVGKNKRLKSVGYSICY